MSLSDFCKSLLFHPIAFIDRYFKGGRVRPLYRKHLETVLYVFPVVFVFLRRMLFYIDLLILTWVKQAPNDYLRHSFMMDFLMEWCLLLIWGTMMYLFLPYVYSVYSWVFQKALGGSEGRVSKVKGVDTALYLAGFSHLMGWIRLPLWILEDFFPPWQGFSLHLYELSFFVWLYICYATVKKLFNVRPWLFMLRFFVLSWLVIALITFLVGLSLSVLMIGWSWILLLIVSYLE